MIVIARHGAQAATDATPTNHCSLLQTIELNWGLPFLGNASDTIQVQSLAPLLTRHDLTRGARSRVDGHAAPSRSVARPTCTPVLRGAWRTSPLRTLALGKQPIPQHDRATCYLARGIDTRSAGRGVRSVTVSVVGLDGFIGAL